MNVASQSNEAGEIQTHEPRQVTPLRDYFIDGSKCTLLRSLIVQKCLYVSLSKGKNHSIKIARQSYSLQLDWIYFAERPMKRTIINLVACYYYAFLFLTHYFFSLVTTCLYFLFL